MTRAEILRTVSADLNALAADRTLARWALCGGLALAVWGAPRATLDVDVLVDLPAGRPAAEAARALVGRGWTLVEHARHPDDPVPELLRMSCGGVGVDLLVAHRAWEAAMLEQAVAVPWQGIDVLALGAEALAAMKLRAGGPQDLADAARLETLPGFDAARFAAWMKRLRTPGGR